jgi:deoxyribodipyrimidine photo-lyase
VKRWLPELRGVESRDIHQPWQMALPPAKYPKPMVDHGVARDRALAAFQKIRKSAS